MRLGLAGLGAMLMLAACGGPAEPRLMNLRSTTTGPDEFSILPTKPLEAPASYAALPPPTPGGRNLADHAPDEEAVAAMGGNPQALRRTGVAAEDGTLLAYAGRNGTDPTIRQELAAEDLEFRRNNRGKLLERLFGVSVYGRAYDRQELDQYSELERRRRQGLRTPAAPPDPAVWGE